MAKYYETDIHWLDGSISEARCLDGNAAWLCKCGEPLLGIFQIDIPPCPGCRRTFEIEEGKKKKPIGGVVEIEQAVG